MLRQAMELSIEPRKELVPRRFVPGLRRLHEGADIRPRRLCHALEL
jgi:hypothetical protein